MKIRTLLILVLLFAGLSPLALMVSLNLPRVLGQFEVAETNRQLLVLQQEYLEASTTMRWGQDTLRALSFSKGVVELVSRNGDGLSPTLIRSRVIEMVEGWYQKSSSVISLRMMRSSGDEQLRMVRGEDGILRVVPNQKCSDANFASVMDSLVAFPEHTVFNAGVNHEHVLLDIQERAVLHLGVALHKDGVLVGLACLSFDLTSLVNEHSGLLFQQDHPDEIIYAATTAGDLLDYFSVGEYDFSSVKPGLTHGKGGRVVRLSPIFVGENGVQNLWMASGTVDGDTVMWVNEWRQQLAVLLCVLVGLVIALAVKMGSLMEAFTTELTVAFRNLLHDKRPMEFSWSGTVELKNLGEELTQLSDEYLEHNAVQEEMRSESKRLETQLRQAQKMEAVGLLAGGVAHDLNNILSGIVSYPQLILLQLPEDSGLRKSILAIQQSGERAAAVVDDLLTVARGVASAREVCDLNQLLKSYVASADYEIIAEAYPSIGCTVKLAKDSLLISCSVVHINKILANLLSHCFESIKADGTVRISSRLVQRDGSDLFWVELVVEDDGVPLSSEEVEHLFEPFYTKRKMGRSGTGLGLAVVWNTMSDHHGLVTAHSDENGTRFTLHFPQLNADAAAPLAVLAETNLRGAGEHILVVDDEAQQRDIASKILNIYGYKVDAVASGEEAVAFCKAQQVDLLLLDMIMDPGINGCKTYEQIEQMYPRQKAIIVSGFSENEEVCKAHECGARGFVKKPYTMEHLAQMVKEELNCS
jgi:signal transduction histidine kinase/CheY-like chemotaxis protein